MKEGFRQCMAWLHTWSGLVVGWVLFFVFATGAAGYFQHEITRWMQPERPLVKPKGLRNQTEAVAVALHRLQQVAPAAARWSITLPHMSTEMRSWQNLSIGWEEMPQPGHGRGFEGMEQLDDITGAVLPPEPEPRSTAGGRALYQLHYLLHYMPRDVGLRIVGFCSMLMLVAIVTGVVTHKKIFKDFFTFRPGKGQRSWLDAHNVISVTALPFFLMITYSGLVFALFAYMPAGRTVLYGLGPSGQTTFANELFERVGHRHAAIGLPAASVATLMHKAESAWGIGQIQTITFERHEGEPPEILLTQVRGRSLDFWYPATLLFNADTGEPLSAEPRIGGSALRTQGMLFNLHEGLFADIWGRWLYFVAGVLGCAMIGTGLVLWTVKRRKHHLAAGLEGGEHFGMRLVENLNVATIAGLPLSVAAYFWANRLLPVEMADRVAWELHTLFAVWLGTLFYALARPLARAWVELLWSCSLVYALVPVLNVLTTNRHLGHSLLARDWVFAGFDLTMLALAALFAVTAMKVRRRVIPRHASELHMPRTVLGKGSV